MLPDPVPMKPVPLNPDKYWKPIATEEEKKQFEEYCKEYNLPF